jgi:hypothetical protein
MKSRILFWLLLTSALAVSAVQAQMVRPPPFFGGVPGMAQFQAMQMQRHQVRTLLYREALEELRKNPQAADVPVCPPIAAGTRTLCIRRPASAPAVETVADPAQEVKPATAQLSAPALQGSLKDIGAGAARRRIAVLVGNNAYHAPIPALGTPIADVNDIAALLRGRFGYETRVLHDAGKAQIVEAINRIADEAKPEDSVLLFYAGHGYLMEDTKMGFWIPVDASEKTAANWISNTDISKLLQAIGSRQLILVSDSCFSGSLTREQKLTSSLVPKAEEILRRRAVLALSSGDEEPVSDAGKGGHSIFAWHLIKSLESVGDAAVGFQVYRSVHDGVVKDYPQTPQYGAVFSAGHMSGGEYLFDTRR